MLPPLEDLDDCKGIHYRIQPNCYKHLGCNRYGLRLDCPCASSSEEADRVPFCSKRTMHAQEYRTSLFLPS